MPTIATVITEAMANVVVYNSELGSASALGAGEAFGVSKGKLNNDGSKEVEIGLASGAGSTLLNSSALTISTLRLLQ